jgi:Trypsin-co-occurring domain 1
MAKLIPIQVDEKTIIYIEATEDIEASEVPVQDETSEDSDDGFEERGLSAADIQKRARESFQAIEGTIRTYTTHTLSAFKNLPDVNIDKVTLKFGVEIGGEAGIPYITKGTAKSNLNIEVECSFPKKDSSSSDN